MTYMDPPGEMVDTLVRVRISKLFHELWTSQVGKEGYDKKKWMELQELLSGLGVSV